MSLYFCFTTFSSEELEDIKIWDNIKYLICQKEICPTTNKEHYQGYMELYTRKRITTLHNLFGTTHFEKRRGTQQQAIDYCIKSETSIENSIYEQGEKYILQQGRRTDLEDVKLMIQDGKTILDVADQHFGVYLRYGKMINNYINSIRPKKLNLEKKVVWISGLPGVGKTRYVYDNNDIDDIYSCFSLKWFDGYYNHKVVLIDDFDLVYPGYDYRTFLKLLDIYPITVETKGGSVSFQPEILYITSNESPQNLFKFYGSNCPVFRRITEYKQF